MKIANCTKLQSTILDLFSATDLSTLLSTRYVMEGFKYEFMKEILHYNGLNYTTFSHCNKKQYKRSRLIFGRR